MTEIERKALALVNEMLPEGAYHAPDHFIDKRLMWNALCRAIEQHEAFRQEVSDAVEDYCGYVPPDSPSHPITRFIIAKPDPLVEVVKEASNPDYDCASLEAYAEVLRAAMKARGYEWTKIVWEGE